MNINNSTGLNKLTSKEGSQGIVASSKLGYSGFKPSMASFVSIASKLMGGAAKTCLDTLQSKTESLTTRLSPSISNMKTSSMSLCMNVGTLINTGLASATSSIASGRGLYGTEGLNQAVESGNEGVKGMVEIGEKAMPALQVIGGTLGLLHAVGEFKEGYESIIKASESKTLGGKLYNGLMGGAKISTGVLYGVAGVAILAGASFIAAPILGTVSGGVALIEAGKNLREAKQLSNLSAKMDEAFPPPEKHTLSLSKEIKDTLRKFASDGVEKQITVEGHKSNIELCISKINLDNSLVTSMNIKNEYSNMVKEYAGLKKEVCTNQAKASAVKAGVVLSLGWGIAGLAATGVGAALVIPAALAVGSGGVYTWMKYDGATKKSEENLNVLFPTSPSTSSKEATIKTTSVAV